MDEMERSGYVERTDCEGSNPLQSAQKKTYLRALKCVAEAGTVSCQMLQKRLGVAYADAVDMIAWMTAQGYVENTPEKEGWKRAYITEEEFEEIRKSTGLSLQSKREKQRMVDDALYEACLRLAIKRGMVTEMMFMDTFGIGRVKAHAVVERMYDDRFLGWREGTMGKCVLITAEQFEELYGRKI